jgi:hypothetical protein
MWEIFEDILPVDFFGTPAIVIEIEHYRKVSLRVSVLRGGILVDTTPLTQ